MVDVAEDLISQPCHPPVTAVQAGLGGVHLNPVAHLHAPISAPLPAAFVAAMHGSGGLEKSGRGLVRAWLHSTQARGRRQRPQIPSLLSR